MVVKCSANKFCNALESRIAHHGKGINIIEIANLKTLEVTERLPVYKTDRNDKGVVINFCPFCGTNFIELYPNLFKKVNNLQ